MQAPQSSTIQTVTLSNFDELARRPGVLVLDFSAKWCGPCRVFAPVFAAAAAKHPELAWGAVDSDDDPALCVRLDVRANPTIVFLRDGVVVYKQVGAVSAAKFDALLDRVTRAAA
jgi:thiol-disulfide isomerase/thioredoxin